MQPNVVSEEYLNLQKNIIEEQEKMKELIEDQLNLSIKEEDINFDKIVIAQLKETPVPVNLYEESVNRMIDVLSAQSEEISEQAKLLKEVLTEDVLNDWIKAAILFDETYFEKFSEDNNIVNWLPHFIAEQAIRPFLQIVSKESHMFIHKMSVIGTCPCCGEPARLAKLNKQREKYLLCPRCETEWKRKRLSCIHCGNDDHEQLFYIEVEEDKLSKIEVCKVCRNYTKLIDTGQLIRQKQAALMDLESIHLDFIAQEEGYGAEEN